MSRIKHETIEEKKVISHKDMHGIVLDFGPTQFFQAEPCGPKCLQRKVAADQRKKAAKVAADQKKAAADKRKKAAKAAADKRKKAAKAAKDQKKAAKVAAAAKKKKDHEEEIHTAGVFVKKNKEYLKLLSRLNELKCKYSIKMPPSTDQDDAAKKLSSLSSDLKKIEAEIIKIKKFIDTENTTKILTLKDKKTNKETNYVNKGLNQALSMKIAAFVKLTT